VVPGSRVVPFDDALAEEGVLLALAATAYHAIGANGTPPQLIVGHGVLGRLLARIAVALDGQPTVWENNPGRASGADGYAVVAPDDDPRRDYAIVCDVSGDPTLLDTLIMRLAPRGEIVLAGFYSEPLSFTFPPAFMKEARIRVAAEWHPADMAAVIDLLQARRLSLGDLITHRQPAEEADQAYRTAFNDPSCLKMILDWRAYA
jgi:3-hydroxyethyl bacteriochlorophyllide a dehydrogenase